MPPPPASAHEDDEFAEYNPHPYQGGYDIALTYGPPFPPSPATCYALPHSPTSGEEIPPHPPLPDAIPPPQPERHQPQPHGYGELGCDYRYYYPEQWHWPPEPCQAPYRNPLRRAADYLFGYSQGCGERIIGMDTYGIPIYASKREVHEQGISILLDPVPDLMVHYNEANGDYQDSHQKYTDTWPLLMESETNRSYSLLREEGCDQHCLYREQGYSHRDWCSSMAYDGRPEETEVANPSYVYARIHYEEPHNVQFEQLEPSWNQNYGYYEDLEKHSYPDDDPERRGNYNEQYQSSQIDQLEPYEPTWSRMRGYYEVDYYGKNGAQSTFPFQ